MTRVHTTNRPLRPSTRSRARRRIERLAAGIDVHINGSRPHDIIVKDDRFFDADAASGLDGALDAYVEGWWDCAQLDELACIVLRNAPALKRAGVATLAWLQVAALINNRQKRRRSGQGGVHYDIGNDLFEAMLDRRMIYSCAYWRDAADLDEAQEAKLDLVARKIGLRPGMRVLDIGCGWGGFAEFAAQRGAEVVGITVSQEQLELGRERCGGLPVELRLADYRELAPGRYDAVVSVGMFEHVGPKNYQRFMQIVREQLDDHGVCLLQTIGSLRTGSFDFPWIDRHIFPGAVLPSATQITRAAEGAMVIEDWQNFGADYDRTLMAWHERFQRNWPVLRERYDERFRRLWTCYLLTCAGTFRARVNQLWQIVFSARGIPGGYRAVC